MRGFAEDSKMLTHAPVLSSSIKCVFVWWVFFSAFTFLRFAKNQFFAKDNDLVMMIG